MLAKLSRWDHAKAHTHALLFHTLGPAGTAFPFRGSLVHWQTIPIIAPMSKVAGQDFAAPF